MCNAVDCHAKIEGMSIHFTIERPVAQGGTITTMYFDLDWARRHKLGLVNAGKYNASQITISTTDENGKLIEF